jgi:hypothetical protein
VSWEGYVGTGDDADIAWKDRRENNLVNFRPLTQASGSSAAVSAYDVKETPLLDISRE